MKTQVNVTSELTRQLHDNCILLKYNCPAPSNGIYGWLKEDTTLTLYNPVELEQNVGLYGGPYRPMVGGRKSSGLASVGAFTYSYSSLPDGLTIGRYASISAGLRFIDSSHPLDLLTTSAITFRPKNNIFKNYMTDSLLSHAENYSTTEKPYPRIGHDVWIGSSVTISMGISIGTGSVLASNSTVTKDVPPYAIMGGNPARIIKFRFDSNTIDQLINSEWWDYEPRQVFDTALDNFESLFANINDKSMKKHIFKKITIGA